MATKITKLNGKVFLAFPEMNKILLSELQERFNVKNPPQSQYGDLFYFSENDLPKKCIPYFSKDIMEEPFLLSFDSINDAVNHLKNIQRNWASYDYVCFRRSKLIQEKLPYINLKERKFPVKIPQTPIGLFTLIDEHNLIYSAKTSSFLPSGNLKFIEDHENPPSRAYLKIQESLTMATLFNGTNLPNENSYCFEAGSCPGGWTWVLVGLGAKVFAVDRAELSSKLMESPLVTFKAHDAFTLKPEEIGNVDWIFSDVICYPERLLEWIKMWISHNPNLNMICTIKMQGSINWELLQQFENIPNSKIIHLNYNKHELTWIHTH